MKRRLRKKLGRMYLRWNWLKAASGLWPFPNVNTPEETRELQRIDRAWVTRRARRYRIRGQS